MKLYEIPTHKDSPRIVNAIVEIPKGSNHKYEYNPEYDQFVLDRSLMSAMVYPANYGFIASTLADDGDALDILVLAGEPIDKGTIVPTRVIAALHMIDGGEVDYKLIGVPISAYRKEHIKTIDEFDPLLIDIIENFFKHYKELEGKKVVLKGWINQEDTYKIINESIIDNAEPWNDVVRHRY
jgi:inorganic pyrophosphatase